LKLLLLFLYINLNLFAIIKTDKIERLTHHSNISKYWNGETCKFHNDSERILTEYFYEKVCRRNFKKYDKPKFKFLKHVVGYEYSAKKCTKIAEIENYVKYKKEYSENIYKYCEFKCKHDDEYCRNKYGLGFVLDKEACECLEKECEPLETYESIIPLDK